MSYLWDLDEFEQVSSFHDRKGTGRMIWSYNDLGVPTYIYNRTFGIGNQSNSFEFHQTIENDRTQLNSEKNWPIERR